MTRPPQSKQSVPKLQEAYAPSPPSSHSPSFEKKHTSSQNKWCGISGGGGAFWITASATAVTAGVESTVTLIEARKVVAA